MARVEPEDKYSIGDGEGRDDEAAFWDGFFEKLKPLKESFDSGSEEHPTPLGDFYINEINVESNEISGRKLVGITAFSTTIDPTSEGDPAIAFLARESNEGSEEPSTRGCIRVSKKVLDLITGLPLGTPVQIVG